MLERKESLPDLRTIFPEIGPNELGGEVELSLKGISPKELQELKVSSLIDTTGGA